MLVLTGGDWCKDCRELDRLFAADPALAALRDARYVPVKVFVGSENRNEAALAPFPKLSWLPTLFVLDGEGRVVRSAPSTDFHEGAKLDPAKVNPVVPVQLIVDHSKITIESIQKLVANYYNLRVGELKSRTNSHHVSFPRQIAMYLSKQMTGASFPEIGKRFGGKHHSTVIHAVQKIGQKRTVEKEFDRLMESFVQNLQ